MTLANVGRDAEKQAHYHPASETVTWYSRSWAVFTNLNEERAQNPADLPRGVYAKEMNLCSHKTPYANVRGGFIRNSAKLEKAQLSFGR